MTTPTAPKIVALAGGVGGAKLVDGLARVLPPDRLTVIGNTGDDFRYYGLAVSPDLDTVMYTLAGIAHPINGWGIADDTRQMQEMLRCLGEQGWFGVGDRDLAINVLRTHLLAQGMPLSAVTTKLASALGVRAQLLPMTDDRLATVVETVEHGRLDFQEYFVRHRWQPTVTGLRYEGSDGPNPARPAPGVLEALAQADVIIFCPSNPVLSIEPILRVPGMREAIASRRVQCIAVSPIIAGNAVKGPTVKIMRELGLDGSVQGVSMYYSNLIDTFVVDTQDAGVSVSQAKLVMDIWMGTLEDRERVARDILKYIAEGA